VRIFVTNKEKSISFNETDYIEIERIELSLEWRFGDTAELRALKQQKLPYLNDGAEGSFFHIPSFSPCAVGAKGFRSNLPMWFPRSANLKSLAQPQYQALW
jgi:hypothetical protein